MFPTNEFRLSKLKVLYLICKLHTGPGGGSFYTLRHHAEAFSEVVDPYVIGIGKGPAAALQDLPTYEFIPFYRFEISAFRKLLDRARNIYPDVIHAYDHRALFVARLLGILLRRPVAYTKCGGPNGSSHIPHADRYILFSQENFAHFRKHKRAAQLDLVPHRLLEIETDLDAVRRLRAQLGISDGERVLLRISRFNPYYAATFAQTLNLYDQLRSAGGAWRLVFIGDVQDAEHFQALRDKSSSYTGIAFVTDPTLTSNASRLLPLADAVVATGRGAMEACSLNLRVFCPSADADLPVELTGETVETLYHFNFSERVPIVGTGAVRPLDAPPDTRAFFEQYFDIRRKLDFYREFYRELARQPRSIGGPTSLLYHLAQFVRH